jgi:NAD(P)-dependent dehydrogenase (short-subunit alcohol dehydrogenase family)
MNAVDTDRPLDPFRIDDRLIVVTGASQGIGRYLAESYARAGAVVVLASRRKDKLDEARAAIAAQGGRAEVVPADVSRLDDVAALADAVWRFAERDGRHIVLVNNAGLGFTKPALEVDEADWERVFEAQVKGTFFCSQRIGALMLERGYGKIINMSSTWAVRSEPGKSVYCAAKAAISQLTVALSTEWAPHGVRVNALAPATTMTEAGRSRMDADPARAALLKSRIRLGRFAEPSDLVGAAVFLASAASDFVTGQTLFVDGGFTN